MKGTDRRKQNKNAGFSLLELLIAVVILAIIVIPLLHLFLSSHKLNIKSRQTLRATTLAQDIMEGLKAYDIEELKEQFNNPSDGFYVIDDKLIKGAVAEETSMEVDGSGNAEEGIYYFSLSKVLMQGSEYDALIRVDAREYMEPGTHVNAGDGSPLVLNKAIADARSIDKQNGTFVETAKIRQAVLDSVWSSPNENIISGLTLPATLGEALAAAGVDETDFRNKLCYKNLDTCFNTYGRTIEITLEDSTELDETGRPKIQVTVTQTYSFAYNDFRCSTKGKDLNTVDGIGCGQVSRANPNINIFYYPLYGNGAIDEIIINDNTDPKWSQPTDSRLSILIAKQMPPQADPSDPSYDPVNPDPEIMTDAQLMAAEMSYVAEVNIRSKSGSSMDKDKFTLKTNLGLNLAGLKYMSGEIDPANRDVNRPDQLIVNGMHMDLSGSSQMNIYTLDGVRSPMGAAAADDEITELFYNVEVSVYEEGAAGKGFPEEERKVRIGGSKNN